jgi:hypothetical protein
MIDLTCVLCKPENPNHKKGLTCLEQIYLLDDDVVNRPVGMNENDKLILIKSYPQGPCQMLIDFSVH